MAATGASSQISAKMTEELWQTAINEFEGLAKKEPQKKMAFHIATIVQRWKEGRNISIPVPEMNRRVLQRAAERQPLIITSAIRAAARPKS